MTNELTLPITFVNLVDIADADDFNANYVACNDKVYRSPTPPTSPYLSQFWVKSDEDEDSPFLLNMWTGTKWKAIQLMDKL